MDFNFKFPTLDLQILIHESNTSNGKEALRKYLINNSMLKTYQSLVIKNIIQDNKQDIKLIKETKQKKIDELMEMKDKDPENSSYVKSIDIQIAELYAQFMDTEKALEMLKNILFDESSLSLQMDIYLCRIRMGMLIKDKKLVEDNIHLATECCELGCDWDIRNKIKIHKAIYNLKQGIFSETAQLFSETLPSFETNEAVDFKHAVEYFIFSGLLSFERSDLKKLLLECSEVLEIGSSEGVNLIRSMYECNYYEYLPNLCKYIESVKNDFYLQNFLNFFCRETKIKMYKQLLNSYQSLDLKNMADVFGISSEYLEDDLNDFIVERRINCKIDKVSYTIIINEEEYDGYSEIIKEGASLLKIIHNNIN